MIRYDISPLDPEAHLFIVAIRVTHPSSPEQSFELPSWISGSYLIRDYARHIQRVRAFIDNKPIAITKKGKSTWSVNGVNSDGELVILYEVFAFDTSVRGAYLDTCRGFFNPGAVLLRVCGLESEKVCLNIAQCDEATHCASSNWKIATSLKRDTATKRFDWGLYTAKNYDELIDAPVELSDFTVLTFNIFGTRHDIVISAPPINLDTDRLAKDVEKICEREILFFEPHKKRSPVREYVFLLNVTSNQFGGLEHRASCALSAPAKSFPCLNDKTRNENYIELLNLFAHEYFHTWFVKRIAPTELINIDFSKETPTTLLWLFEGFTTYYADLILMRTKLITREDFAKRLTKNFQATLERSAHKVQTLKEASFDAWIKFYKPSSNAINAYVSYYKQGALAALVLDLFIRKKTQGKKNLDIAIQALWESYKETSRYQGISEKDFLLTVNKETTVNVAPLLRKLIDSTVEINYTAFLTPFGAKLEESELPLERKLLGLKGSCSDAGFTVAQVFEGEAGAWAGIAPGDVLIAIDGVRLTASSFHDTLSRYAAGDEMVIHAFRDNAMIVWTLLLGKEKTIRSTFTFKKSTPLANDWLT